MVKEETEGQTIYDIIRLWAKQKGIYDKGDSKTQSLKLVEEVGELAKAVLNRDDKEVYDAIGDCVVVLTNIIELYEKEKRQSTVGPVITTNLEECVELSVNVILKRKGSMINGTFVKDND